MVDAAVDVAKILVERLLECKKQFDDLATLSDDLQEQLEQLVHLCEQRRREPRFAGAVQKHFGKRLRALSDDLNAIFEKRSGGTGSKLLLFFGTLWGSGAAADKLLLQQHMDAIDKLLTKVQVEAGTVTASATEELAGGAAAKFIGSESMQQFWRSQFKNELKLAWDVFEETLLLMSDFRHSFPHHGRVVLSAVRGKMDYNGDDQIHVAEFSRLFASSSEQLPKHHTVVDVVRHHMTGGERQLLGALTFSPVATVRRVATHGGFFAIATDDGFIKAFSCSPSANGISLISQIVLSVPPSAVTIAYLNNQLLVFVGLERSVHGYDAWSGRFVFAAESLDTPQEIVVFRGCMFIRGKGTGHRVQVLQGDSASLSRWTFSLTANLNHFASVMFLCPLNETLILCCTAESGCVLWNYVLGQELLRIPHRLQNPRLVGDEEEGEGAADAVVYVGGGSGSPSPSHPRQRVHWVPSVSSEIRVVGNTPRGFLYLRIFRSTSASTLSHQGRPRRRHSGSCGGGVAGDDSGSGGGGDTWDYEVQRVGVPDQIHSFGRVAIKYRDRLVRVYEYAVDDQQQQQHSTRSSSSPPAPPAAAVRVTGTHEVILPRFVSNVRVTPLESRLGFLVTGTLQTNSKLPVWMVYNLCDPALPSAGDRASTTPGVAEGRQTAMVKKPSGDGGAEDASLPLAPLTGMFASWSPLDANTYVPSWAARSHPAIVVPGNPSSGVGSEFILSSVASRRIRLLDLQPAREAVSVDFEQMLTTGERMGITGTVSAIAADGADILVATSDGWILRYDFTRTTRTTLGSEGDGGDDRSTTTAAVELSAFLDSAARSMTPESASRVIAGIAQLSRRTVNLVRTALAEQGILVHGQNSAVDNLDSSMCEKFVSTLVDLKARLLLDAAAAAGGAAPSAPLQSVYHDAGRWQAPVAKRWVFDGDETCRTCRQQLTPLDFVAQICRTCYRQTTPGKLHRCIVCDTHCGEQYTLCDACYETRRRAMQLQPMCLTVCAGYLFVGCCVDERFYGPAGGALLKLTSRDLHVVDRLSKSFVPFFNNLASAEVPRLGVAFVVAPISYATVAIFHAPQRYLTESIVATYEQQCLQAVEVAVVDNTEQGSYVDVFSSTLSLDLMWQRFALGHNHNSSTSPLTRMAHVTGVPAIYIRLICWKTYLFAADKVGVTTVYQRGADSLTAILRCQAQTARLSSSVICHCRYVSLSFDGVVGVLPLSVVDDVAASSTATASSAQTRSGEAKESFLVLGARQLDQATDRGGGDENAVCAESPAAAATRIDKHWQWKRHHKPDDRFVALNDVEKQLLTAELLATGSVVVREPGSAEGEVLVTVAPAPSSAVEKDAHPATTTTFFLPASGREVIRVRQHYSARLPPPAYQLANAVGTENLVRLRAGESQTIPFECPWSELSAGKRAWIHLHLFSGEPCVLRIHDAQQQRLSLSQPQQQATFSHLPKSTRISSRRERHGEDSVWISIGSIIPPLSTTFPNASSESMASVDDSAADVVLTFSVVEGTLIFKRIPAVVELRSLPHSPMLFVES